MHVISLVLQPVQFIGYSKITDTIVMKNRKNVKILNPVSFETISSFNFKEECVNFGILDQIFQTPLAYCQYLNSYIEIYNYQAGTIVMNIILDNSKPQNSIGVFQPTAKLAAERQFNASIVTHLVLDAAV